MNILKIFNPKSKHPVVFEVDTDKDIQLINFLKAQNRNDFILGKIDAQEFELQDAEIEAIGLRMAERRLNEIERRRNGETLERQI